MFLKKKYVLVKEEHEIKLILKLLVALVILVTVFGTPILLGMFSKKILGEKQSLKGNSSHRNCDKGHGCLFGEDNMGNGTDLFIDIDNVTLWDLENSTGIPGIIPLVVDEDFNYEYPDYEDLTTTERHLGALVDLFDPRTLYPEEETTATTAPYNVDDWTTVSYDEGGIFEKGDSIVDNFYNARNGLNLSALGDVLFRQGNLPPGRNGMFKIVVWKDGKFLERRHINYFTNTSHNPFADCPVKNCILSYDVEDMSNADAVVFLLLRQTAESLPDGNEPRPPNQRWIFLSDESPPNTFLFKKTSWSDFPGVFNWSMTYRMESDIPVANMRVIPLDIYLDHKDVKDLIPRYEEKQREVLLAVILNDCSPSNSVYAYIEEMRKYMDVDIYGKCKNVINNCPAHFARDCPSLNKYMFYFTFETSVCKEYMSQKMSWNSFEKGAVPIVAGFSHHDCRMIFPPNSYLHVEDFSSARDLANYILKINSTWEDSYMMLHEWRKYFKVVNEHGYFGSHSYHYCRICQALNYNDESPKVYSDLSNFLSPQKNCKV